jgi:uncharacterized iron-regulated membrane protein
MGILAAISRKERMLNLYSLDSQLYVWRKSTVKLRRAIFQIHLYTGLLIGALITLSGLTGSLLVFGQELDEALNPNLLCVSPQGEPVSIQMVIDAVRQNYPTHDLKRIKLPQDIQSTYEVRLNFGERVKVYIDPYTNQILGSRTNDNSIKEFVYVLHAEMFAGEIGKTVIGISAILLLLLIITGVIVWWPGRKHLRRGLTIQRKASWKRINHDIHNVFGIFAMPLLLLSAITGVYLIFHAPFERVVAWLTGSSPRLAPPRVASHKGEGFLPLDRIVKNADAALPEGKTTWVILPSSPTAAIIVRKKLPAEMHPVGRSFVHLDPCTGEVLLVENALQAPPGTRMINTLYPLHTGVAGGFFTRVLQFICGLVPAVLYVSGFIKWWNRIVVKKHHPPVANCNISNH